MNNHVARESGLVKFLRFGLYVVVFIVPLVIFKDFLSPFNFGKTIVFRSIIEILGAVYLVLILKDRTYLPGRQAGLPRRDKLFWAFLLFTTVFTVTTLTSVNMYLSFWGSLERMGGLWTFWHYFLYFIILVSVFNKKEHWHKFFNLLIFGAMLSALYGFGQKTDIKFFIGSGGRERIFGTLGNAALFAGYELFFVFLSLMMFFQPGNTQNRKILYLTVFGISSIAVLVTAVRGSILGYGVGLIIFAFLWTKYNRSQLGKYVLIGLLVMVVVFVAFSLLFQNSSLVKHSSYLSRITSLSWKSPTIQTRIWAWQSGLEGWKENAKTIILGWGPESYNVPFSKHFNPKTYVGVGSETLFDRAHNNFIEALVTMGIIGFFAYIYIFIALFVSLGKLLSKENFSLYGIALISLVTAYAIHNALFFDATSSFMVFFGVMGFTSFLSAESAHQEGVMVERRPLVPKSWLGPIIVALVVAISLLIYKTNILPARANYATTRALVSTFKGNAGEALEKFKIAVSYDVPGKYEFRHRFAEYLVGVNGPSVKEPEVREAYKVALDGLDKNIEENPQDYLPYLYGSRLNILLGSDDPKSPYLDKALIYSNKALEISPTFIRTYYEIAQAYLAKKDDVKAMEYFQKAIDLNSNAGISYWYMATTKIEMGDLKAGREYLDKSALAAYPAGPKDYEYLRLVDAYLKEKDYADIAHVYEQLIGPSLIEAYLGQKNYIIVNGAYEPLTGKNPSDPQHLASLAAAYVQIGRIDDAVKITRKAVEIDPSFEPDAKIFLKSIGRRLEP